MAVVGGGTGAVAERPKWRAKVQARPKQSQTEQSLELIQLLFAALPSPSLLRRRSLARLIPASWAPTVDPAVLVLIEATQKRGRDRARPSAPHGPQQRKGEANQGKTSSTNGKHRSDGNAVFGCSRLVLRGSVSTGGAVDPPRLRKGPRCAGRCAGPVIA